MSAQVISFPSRRFSESRESIEKRGGSAEVVQLHAAPASFWDEDLPMLTAYLPRLAGEWTLTSSAGAAILSRKSGWDAFRRSVVIRREGDQLRLMIDRFSSGLHTIGMFHTMTLAMETLADDVGWRAGRRQRRGREI